VKTVEPRSNQEDVEEKFKETISKKRRKKMMMKTLEKNKKLEVKNG
jgi:hypothetical protein